MAAGAGASGWARRWAPAVLLLAGAASIFWQLHPYFSTRVDSSRYILLAQALADGEGYSYLGKPFTVQMPGFPLLLTPPIALFGIDFLKLNLLGSLIGLAGAALLFVYCRPRVGMPVAAAVAAALWLSQGYQTLCQAVLSDVPAAVAALACLLLDRWARRRRSPGRDLVVGVAIAVACYLRSVNGLLLPAILMGRLLDPEAGAERRAGLGRFAVRRSALIVLVPLLLVLPWWLRNESLRTGEPATLQHDYSHWVALTRVDRNDPASPRLPVSEIAARIPGQLSRLAGSLGGRLETINPVLETRLADRWVGALGLACLVVVALVRRRPGELYALGMTAVLALYYHYRGRFGLPVYILALAAVPDAVLLLAARANWPRRPLAWILTGAIGLLAIADHEPRAVREKAARSYREWVSVSEQIRSEYPAGGRFGAHIGAGFTVFTGSPFYNLRYATQQGGREGLLELLAERRMDAVVVTPLYRELLIHLLDRYGAEHCATLSEDWPDHSNETWGERLWLFRLDRPVAAGSAPCERAALYGKWILTRSEVTALVGVNVVPLDRPRVLLDQTVLVRDRRVARIAPRGEVPIPPRAWQVDGRGFYLLPGLTDLQVRLESRRDLHLYLANGVTLVAERDGSPDALALRDALASGAEFGPRLLVAGPRPERPASDPRRALAAQQAAGYDLPRLRLEPGDAARRALAEIAAEAGPPVIATAPGGLDPTLLPPSSRRSWLLPLEEYPPTIDSVPDLAQRRLYTLTGLVAARRWLAPEGRRSMLERQTFGYLAPERLESWLGVEPAPGAAVGRRTVELSSRLELLAAAGAPVVLGTGAGTAFVAPGFSLREELGRLERSGLTRFEALRAATVNAGEMLGRPLELGPLREGRAADLVMVVNNPFEGPLTRPAGLMIRGRWFAARDLAELLEAVAAAD